MTFILSSLYLELLLVLVATVFLLYKFSTRNFGYWQRKGVPHPKPLPFFGNFLDVLTFRSTIGNLLSTLYNEYKVPYFGIYILNRPNLVVRSPELIRNILVKDFNYFCDRNILSDEKCDSLTSKMLFVVNNPEWKFLRQKMTPVFTSGKLKNMFDLIMKASEDLKAYLNKNITKDSNEIKEICAKYSTDVITSCAFGIEANSFKYEKAEFREIGRKMFSNDWDTSLRQSCYFMAHGIVKFFRMQAFVSGVTDFLRNVFWKTIEERERTKQKRNDLIDIIVQIRAQQSSNDEIPFVGDRVVAQAAQFFLAGFETISATMAFALYELCVHPKIQNKLRSEIKSVVSEHGSLTYEAIQDMKYLHMVIFETLRKYPALPFLDRTCIADYKLPDSDFVIEKGTPVFIPMFGLQYDPEYFSDPQKFDPERFSEENKASMRPFTYLPFGDGPRICIGERFGLLVTKLGIAQIVSEFELEPNKETPIPLVFDTKTLVLASAVGLPMKLKKFVSDAA